MTIEIRPLDGLEELSECEQLQAAIWGFNPHSIIPHHLLLTVQKNGGILLGAFEGVRMIGFVFSIPGWSDGLRKHCSMMCGVVSEWRSRGIGLRLKWAQREAALSQGVALITWTFDPLQSANAHFNLNKLGAIARRYDVDLYGDIRDRLNEGLPTDRLTAEWWLASDRVVARVEGEIAQAHRPSEGNWILTGQGEDGVLEPGRPRLDLEGDELFLEFPRHLGELKRADPQAASAWRLSCREALLDYLSKGYRAEAVTAGRAPQLTSAYVLRRARDPEVGE